MYEPPERLNIADYFLDDRLREGGGERRALITADGEWTYAEVSALANRFGHLLRDAGVEPEQRVIIAMPDGPEYVAALFGTLKIGAVVVMVNPHLKRGEIEYLLEYTRAKAVFAHGSTLETIRPAAEASSFADTFFVVDEPGFADRVDAAATDLETFDSHRDDAAIWLFSGGTTGKPKAVVQTHASFAFTTEAYGKGVLTYAEDDVTLSVPKLFFGYATGSNLFFPFSVGATAALFPERCTTETLLDAIERFRPTILVNVPTMINHLLSHEGVESRDFSSLRLATSAGEALPAELHSRWDEIVGVDLLDGLGTAEMWHIFLSNRPGDVRPGTLGHVVPGFEVRVCDDEGRELPDGEVGWLWVRGGARAIGYWQQMEKTQQAFRGEWYVSGDMIVRDADGIFTYSGRGDDMLKVKGKWLSPREVENTLLQHPVVREAAVVGVPDPQGLTRPHAFVIADATPDGLAAELADFLRDRLSSYKCPERFTFLDDFPRTHLGKVDRGRIRALSNPR